MRVIAKLIIDEKEIVLSDRDYASQPLNWIIVENAKVDAMVKLNKIVGIKDPGVNFS